MTPQEIVDGLNATDAAQVAASQATTQAIAAAVAAVQALPTGTAPTPEPNTVSLQVGEVCTNEAGVAGTLQDDGTGSLVCVVS